MSMQKIMIAMPIEEELLRPLYAWGKRFDWREVKTVYFAHAIKKNLTPLEFGLMELPDEGALKEMRPVMMKFLADEARKILPKDFRGEAVYQVEADFNPQEAIVALVRAVKPDVVVASTRGKHGFQGLFHSSFTDHLIRFAPCDVFVVRPFSE